MSGAEGGFERRHGRVADSLFEQPVFEVIADIALAARLDEPIFVLHFLNVLRYKIHFLKTPIIYTYQNSQRYNAYHDTVNA